MLEELSPKSLGLCLSVWRSESWVSIRDYLCGDSVSIRSQYDVVDEQFSYDFAVRFLPRGKTAYLFAVAVDYYKDGVV